jgi:hypothetical protein
MKFKIVWLKILNTNKIKHIEKKSKIIEFPIYLEKLICLLKYCLCTAAIDEKPIIGKRNNCIIEKILIIPYSFVVRLLVK